MADKKASLAELMGQTGANLAQGGGLTLDQLPMILGDAMPELPRDAVGRHRLVRALQQRFGSNFRSLPGIGSLLKEFDQNIEFEKRVAKLSAVRYRREDRG